MKDLVNGGWMVELRTEGMECVLDWYVDSRVSRTASLVLRARPEENAILASVVSMSWLFVLGDESGEDVGGDGGKVPSTMVSPTTELLLTLASSMYSRSSVSRPGCGAEAQGGRT
jgi:hypothetical protein